MQFGRSEKLLLLGLIVGVIHHVDHVLRADHTGWPVVPQVTPFTFSLLVYPIFLSVFLVKPKPWYRVVATGFLFLFATASHTFLETPFDQYHTWAYGK